MKQKKSKRLSLRKITISNLDQNVMRRVHGGATLVPECPPDTWQYTNCWTKCATNCEQCPPPVETIEISFCVC